MRYVLNVLLGMLFGFAVSSIIIIIYQSLR